MFRADCLYIPAHIFEFYLHMGSTGTALLICLSWQAETADSVHQLLELVATCSSSSSSTSSEQIFGQTIDMPGWLEQRPLVAFPLSAGYERQGLSTDGWTGGRPKKNRNRGELETFGIAWAEASSSA